LGIMNEEVRTSEIGLARYAREYYDAAIAADNVIGHRKGYEIVAPAPVMFLIAHAIELALKAYLRWKGVDLGGLKKVRHNLEACWAAACEHGVTEHVSLTDEELGILRLISDLHSSTELRYIQTGYKQFPVFGPLQQMSAKVLNTICPLVGFK
jgi:hypothetical protein